MRKFIWIAILFLLAACAAGPTTDRDSKSKSATVLVQNEGFGFYIDRPTDWQLDEKTAKKIGVAALFLPDGYSFARAPAVIYASSYKKEEGKSYSMTDFIGSDYDRYKNKRPEIRMKEMGQVPTRNNRKAILVAYFDAAGGPQSHEVVAYIEDKLITAVVVLSTDHKDRINIYLPVFNKMVASYNFHGPVK